MRATKTSILLDPQGKDIIAMQKLGATYRVEYHPPMIATQAPQQPANSQSTFNYAPVGPKAFDTIETVRKSFVQALGFDQQPVPADDGPCMGVMNINLEAATGGQGT